MLLRVKKHMSAFVPSIVDDFLHPRSVDLITLFTSFIFYTLKELSKNIETKINVVEFSH